jgi:ANTAR domain/GAF domain
VSDDDSVREAALMLLATSAAENVPGVDCVSITIYSNVDHAPHTAASSDPLAEQADALQYELREGPCYDAVTDERFAMVNDLAVATDYPNYGPKAAALGVGAQAALQLVDGARRAGLNFYARTPGVFNSATVQFAELFAKPAGALLGYAEQVEQLGEALHSRTDIGVALGILMERYGLDQEQAFSFLARNSQTRNVKVRVLARQIIDGTFETARR